MRRRFELNSEVNLPQGIGKIIGINGWVGTGRPPQALWDYAIRVEGKLIYLTHKELTELEHESFVS